MAARPQNIGIKAIELYTPSQVSNHLSPLTFLCNLQVRASVSGTHKDPFLGQSCSCDLLFFSSPNAAPHSPKIATGP